MRVKDGEGGREGGRERPQRQRQKEERMGKRENGILLLYQRDLNTKANNSVFNLIWQVCVRLSFIIICYIIFGY